MKCLNLTDGFNPYNADKVECIEFESFIFSGGEPHIKLDLSCFSEEEDIIVTSRLNSMNDFMMLVVATEAISQSGYCKDRELFIPYFPGSRQDRRMIEGEPLTVKVFSSIINDLDYNQVLTFDNHSDVSTALIDNGTNYDNRRFVERCLESIYPNLNEDWFHLVSPDSGANKKVKDLGKYLYNNSYALQITKCDKTRDVSRGDITGFEVYSTDLEGKDCIIVDDICDGGGTFIGLAKELKAKNAGDIYLIISHGIFSKHVEELQPYFKKVYTTDSWRSDIDSELVEVIKFEQFI